MKLFRKILLSLFPEGFEHGGGEWPSAIGMFVWLVSPKQFFSLIHRKIIENYKLNLFDINLDSFEVKIGFGEQVKMGPKEMDAYFSYNATANMNGWTFYAPSTIASLATMVCARLMAPVMRPYESKYAIAFFESIVVLCYTFTARIKVMDLSNRDEALRRTVDLIFSVMLAMDEELDEDILDQIKPLMLQQIQGFIFLMYTFDKLGSLLAGDTFTSKETIEYILWEQHKKSLSNKAYHALMTTMEQRSRVADFDEIDDEILGNILPSDSMIIALLNDEQRYLIAEHFLSTFMSEEDLTMHLNTLSSDPTHRSVMMQDLTDYTYLKANAYKGIKTLARHKFGMKKSYETSQEIDTFISTIEEKGTLDGMKIPDAIREESMLMDIIMNFYIGFVWGLFTARGDSFALRLFHRDRVNRLTVHLQVDTLEHDVLYYFGWLLYHYSKNLYYYQYAFDNIKDGNEMFRLPINGGTQEIYTNTQLIDMLKEQGVVTLFQDMLPKTLTITVSSQEVLDSFKQTLWPGLQAMLARPREIVQEVYGPLFGLCSDPIGIRNIVVPYWSDLANLKENLYTLDFWLRWEAMDYLSQTDSLQTVYNDASIISIAAMLRDTRTGWMILRHSMMHQSWDKWDKDLNIDALSKIYVVDVLNLSSQFVWVFEHIAMQVDEKYSKLIAIYCKLDDTPQYIRTGIKSRSHFVKEIEDRDPEAMVTGEDIVWLRSYLKTIQYYTKRYLKPKA